MAANATPGSQNFRLEQLSDRAMPGIERQLIGSWHLRAALGVTGRANSVWARGPADLPLAEAVDQVEAWYQERGLTPQFQLFDGADAGLVAELDSRGWRRGDESLVMVADLNTLALMPADPVADRVVAMTAQPTAAFSQLVADDQRMTEVTATELPQRFVTIADSHGRLLGGGMTTTDHIWTCMLSMKTLPIARRTGVATDVLGAMGSAAKSLGAERAWLQVQADNVAALALYRRLAFETAHRYRYRSAPEGELRS